MPNLDLKTRMAVQEAYDTLRNALAVRGDEFLTGDKFDALDYALNILGQEAGADVRPIAKSPRNGRINL